MDVQKGKDNMNLNELFPIQKKLDDRILKEKELKKEDVFQRKVVALICELYECVNEARFFKYWSENTNPRTYGFDDDKDCEYCNGTGTVREHPSDTGYNCPDCEGSGFMHYNPLLEEYVDVIHFAIGLANDIGYTSHEYLKTEPKDLNNLVLGITNAITVFSMTPKKELMESILNNIIALGYQLGFDEGQVIEAYHAKNKENHERQEAGY